MRTPPQVLLGCSLWGYRSRSTTDFLKNNTAQQNCPRRVRVCIHIIRARLVSPWTRRCTQRTGRGWNARNRGSKQGPASEQKKKGHSGVSRVQDAEGSQNCPQQRRGGGASASYPKGSKITRTRTRTLKLPLDEPMPTSDTEQKIMHTCTGTIFAQPTKSNAVRLGYDEPENLNNPVLQLAAASRFSPSPSVHTLRQSRLLKFRTKNHE